MLNICTSHLSKFLLNNRQKYFYVRHTDETVLNNDERFEAIVFLLYNI